MKNIVISGDYLSCKIKHTNEHVYISVKNSLALFISPRTIKRADILYTDNKNRYSVKIFFKNLKTSVLDIDQHLFSILMKSLSHKNHEKFLNK